MGRIFAWRIAPTYDKCRRVDPLTLAVPQTANAPVTWAADSTLQAKDNKSRSAVNSMHVSHKSCALAGPQ